MPAIKYKVNCRVCQYSKGNPKFRDRLRHAAYRREDGDESIGQIAKAEGFNLKSIYNHVNKHMTDVSENYSGLKEIRIAKKKEEFKAKAQKELELAVDGDVMSTIEARPAEIIALDEYIAQGKAKVDAGELKITAQSFLAAVKIKSDWASKQQSNKLDYMKTIYALSSGNKKKADKDEPSGTGTTTGMDNSGQEQSSTILRETTGNQTP